MRLGLWAARASATHPCCPSQGRQLRLGRSRPVSAGAWPASTRWCLRLLRGEPVEAVSRQLGVPVWQLERWRARALARLKTGLRGRSEDPAERELAEAHRRIGELSMEVELLRARIERPGPLARRRSR